MMRTHNMPGTGAPFAFGADPIADAFSAGQSLYKSNLLNTINLFRAQEGKPPLGWPARGATPTQTLWTEGSARLLRYRSLSSEKAPKAAPVLAVCSLVNRPYVLDLLTGRSVVQSLLSAGRDVWLLDWGTPDAAANELGLDHYALGLIPRALDFVQAHTGAPAHLLGYCMGGTLSLIALAAGARARSLIAMATPVDLHDDGLLSLWTRAPGFDPRSITDVYGHAPAHLLQPAFKMLDPVGLSTKLIHVRERVGDDAFMSFFLAMEQWLEDSVAFPGRAFIEWIQLYRDNALTQARYTVGARKLSLRDLTLPIFSLLADGDYISPASSSLAIETAAPNARHTIHKIDGGHIGLATGSGAHKRAWPAVAAWLDEVDAAQDVKAAPVRAKAASRTKKARGKR